MVFEIARLLSEEDLRELRQDVGSAPFRDGKLTARGVAQDVKYNLQLDARHQTAQKWSARVVRALNVNDRFNELAIPKVVMPPRFCRYASGMEYGPHLDLPVMRIAGDGFRTDLSMTVWLTEPAAYEGGELILQSDFGERRFKGAAGSAVVYPANTRHRVSRIESGERIVAITWIQSMVRDNVHRRILSSVATSANKLRGTRIHLEEAQLLHQVHHDLARMWSE